MTYREKRCFSGLESCTLDKFSRPSRLLESQSLQQQVALHEPLHHGCLVATDSNPLEFAQKGFLTPNGTQRRSVQRCSFDEAGDMQHVMILGTETKESEVLLHAKPSNVLPCKQMLPKLLGNHLCSMVLFLPPKSMTNYQRTHGEQTTTWDVLLHLRINSRENKARLVQHAACCLQ